MLMKFRSNQLAVQFYKACASLKLLRASSSVALNLAEGSGRFTPADKLKFYRIAYASLRECEAVLTLHGSSDPALISLLEKLSCHVYRLCVPRGRS